MYGGRSQVVRQWIVTPSFAGSSPVVRPNIKINEFMLLPSIFITNTAPVLLHINFSFKRST